MAGFRLLQMSYLMFIISAFQLMMSSVNAEISNTMFVYWGAANHSSMHADDLQLVLDQTSGSGVQSKREFLFGSFEMQIKLVPGNSAGTVTAYYLSSTGNKHDEIDFEFLGNVTGKPYIIHTNVFTQGHAGREVQFHPWFDPTADYHNYTIHWNPNTIIWYIDGVPIRVYRNYSSLGIPYPNQQPMRIYSSLWDADDWATRAGLDKIDWSKAPFIAKYRNFRPRACYWNGTTSITQCAMASRTNWWSTGAFSRLSYAKAGQMNWVRKNFMVYDYCKDTKRFKGLMPGECYMPQS